jgi:hypothetical protein
MPRRLSSSSILRTLLNPWARRRVVTAHYFSEMPLAHSTFATWLIVPVGSTGTRKPHKKPLLSNCAEMPPQWYARKLVARLTKEFEPVPTLLLCVSPFVAHRFNLLSINNVSTH